MLLCTYPFLQDMEYRLEIMGIFLRGFCGSQCANRLQYFSFANWIYCE